MQNSTQSYISIGEAATILGVAVVTLIRWDRNQDRKYNKMLSQFSYQKILNGIDMIGNKYGIRVRKVNRSIINNQI